MPNGALASLAGNVDPHHKVAIADLILAQGKVRETICQLMESLDPDLVGLSIMTFQRHTAMEIMDLVRSIKPGVLIVVGGYDPSLAREAYTDVNDPKVDFVVRGEGEITFRNLLRAIERNSGFEEIAGLSFRSGGTFQHNPDRQVSNLESGQIRPPDRGARVLDGYMVFGRQVDVVETSRGCTFDCSFCSIIEMRGRNYHRFDIDQVIDDIRDAHTRGARSIFFVDDNITLNIRRFEELCRAIIAAKLNSIDYIIQAMTSSIADHGETLAPLMRAAGFRYVFLGIENVVQQDLDFLKASSKNRRRVNGRRVGNAAATAIEYLHDNGMYVVGGLIVGNPTDTREQVWQNLRFAEDWFDLPYIQHPIPYPGTPMAADLLKRGLVINHNVEEYDGTTSVVACENLSAAELEFMRWDVERWIKLRHGWVLLGQDTIFTIRNLWSLIAFIFRGETIKSYLGIETRRQAFDRYCEIRRREKQFL
jgi:radical SAM superfamily enzyme YgiQ (UPF0313 family)